MSPDGGRPGDEQPGGAAPASVDASEGDDPGVFFVFIAADPPDFEKDGTDDDPPLSKEEEKDEALQRWLEKAFADGYQQYEKAIVSLLSERDQVSYDPETVQDQLPRLSLDVTGEWRGPPPEDDPSASDVETIALEEIVFDRELMVTLLDLYILDGWEPMVEIGTYLDAQLERLRSLRGNVPSGGTEIDRIREIAQLAPWQPARALFHLARNAVAQLVREQLANIEKLAAIRIQSNVAEEETTFAAITGRLAWKETEKKSYVGARPDIPEEATRKTYRLEDRSLAGTYEQALKEGVAFRAELDKSFRELTVFESEVQSSVTKRKSVVAGSSYAKAVESARATLKEQNKKAEERASESKMQLLNNEPILGLVFPALKPRFESATPAWEGMLYDEIASIKETLRELRENVAQDAPFTVKLSKSVDINEQPLSKTLLALDPPPRGFEEEMAERAIVGLSNGQTAWFPLASENTLHELVAREEVEIDSLGYVVYVHYVQTLAERLDQEERNREASKQFWLNFSRLLAALSLVTLVTPASSFLRVLANFGAVVAQAQSFWSIASEIQRVRTLHGLTAAEVTYTLEALGRLGELLAIRNDLLDGLGEEVVLGMLMHIFGQVNIRLIQESLLAYGLYQDIETLLVSDDDAPSQSP
jgi:hypothetical protein